MHRVASPRSYARPAGGLRKESFANVVGFHRRHFTNSARVSFLVSQALSGRCMEFGARASGYVMIMLEYIVARAR